MKFVQFLQWWYKRFSFFYILEKIFDHPIIVSITLICLLGYFFGPEAIVIFLLSFVVLGAFVIWILIPFCSMIDRFQKYIRSEWKQFQREENKPKVVKTDD